MLKGKSKNLKLSNDNLQYKKIPYELLKNPFMISREVLEVATVN